MESEPNLYCYLENILSLRRPVLRIWIRIESGYKWVSASGFRQGKIAPPQKKKEEEEEEISCLKSFLLTGGGWRHVRQLW